MIKLILVIACMVILTGCDVKEEMPRSEVIKACKECTDAGLKPKMMVNGVNNRLVGIRCEP